MEQPSSTLPAYDLPCSASTKEYKENASSLLFNPDLEFLTFPPHPCRPSKLQDMHRLGKHEESSVWKPT